MIKKKYYRNYINHNNEKTRLIKSIYYTITEVILIFILIILNFKFTNKEVNIKYNNMIQINEEKNITKKNNIKEINKLKNNKQKNNNKKEINQKGIKRLQFYLQKKKAYFSISEINRYNSYIKKCQDKEFLNDTLYNKSENPKITVIMPVYNRANDLYYSIRSIQYQKMKDIEIVLINDGSTDKTLETIQKFKEEDPRIKIINNEKNRRILFSKSIGALYANGKYILELDQDDMFISSNAFNILYNEAENNNLDLLQFRDFTLQRFHFDKNVKGEGMIFEQETKIETQPDIKNEMFKKYNYLLWGLLIKADIYKKAVIYMWPYIINYKIIHYEDFTVTFFFVVLSKKFKYLNNFYIAHLNHDKSASSNREFRKEYHTSVLLFYNFMFEYHIKNNPEDIVILINLINNNRIETYELQTTSPKLFEYVFKKIFDYFSNDQKTLFMDVLKLKDVHIQIGNTYQYYMKDSEYNSILSFHKLNNNTNININYTKSNIYPKISVIVYFKEITFLQKTITSIENQKNFDNFEIILICDNNNEILLEYVNLLLKIYKNIILINNTKERGLFYSYSIGVLKSKGEYIMTIKPGYTLATENFFYELNQSIDNNTDILEFNLLINNNEEITDTSLKLYRCSHFKSEIDLDFLKFNTGYKQIDQEKELIINKLIKSNIYKSIIKEYESFFIDNITSNYYDEILMFLINQRNIVIKHINSTEIIEHSKIINNFNIFQINDTDQILIKDSISYINFLYNHTEDSVKSKAYALSEFYNIMNVIYNKFNEISKEAMDLIYMFLKSEYISKYDKSNLITYYNVLIDRYKYDELKQSII